MNGIALWKAIFVRAGMRESVIQALASPTVPFPPDIDIRGLGRLYSEYGVY